MKEIKMKHTIKFQVFKKCFRIQTKRKIVGSQYNQFDVGGEVTYVVWELTSNN